METEPAPARPVAIGIRSASETKIAAEKAAAEERPTPLVGRDGNLLRPERAQTAMNHQPHGLPAAFALDGATLTTKAGNSERQRRATAFHEAGHAVQAFHEGMRVAKASIVPAGESSGRVTLACKSATEYGEVSEQQAARHARVCLAGLVAQRKFSPQSVRRYHAHQDHEAAAALAFKISGSPQEAEAWLRLWTIQVQQRMDRHWPSVERLAAELMKAGSVSGESVRVLLLSARS